MTMPWSGLATCRSRRTSGMSWQRCSPGTDTFGPTSYFPDIAWIRSRRDVLVRLVPAEPARVWTRVREGELTDQGEAPIRRHIGVTRGLTELWPRRGVDDDGPPIGQRPDRVPRVARHDRGHARSSGLRDAVDRELEFAFEHLVQLLLRMVMLMNRGAASEFVVRDGHVDGMEVSPSPTRQAFGHLQLVDINERHGHTPALSLRERLGLRELRVLAASDSRAPPAIPPYGRRQVRRCGVTRGFGPPSRFRSLPRISYFLIGVPRPAGCGRTTLLIHSPNVRATAASSPVYM